MKLELKRNRFGSNATIGELSIDGVFFCYTLEDEARSGPKVYGKTAIPYGKYQVVIDYSSRFKRDMPHILNVPGFDGIRIHTGNTDKDTEGCILLGNSVLNADFISESRVAFMKFIPKLEAGLKEGEVWIEIGRS